MGWNFVYSGGYSMTKVNLMTQAEYARRRGCSKVAVGKAVKAGRIKLVDGKIDAEMADYHWQKNTRARISRVAPGQLDLEGAGQAGVSGEAVAAGTGDVAGDVGKGDAYTANRSRREAADAEMAELKLAEAQQSLIRIDAVKAVLGSVFSTTRDALLQIPARLSPLLAAESDPATVQTLLYTELHQALQHLASAPSRIGQTESAAE